MSKNHEIENLAKEIQRLLKELEHNFWDVFAYDEFYEHIDNIYYKVRREDIETWLFHGTRELYYKICLFLELKSTPIFLKMFTDKFEKITNQQKKVLKSRGPLYDSSDPSMIIHDDFRDFLSGFAEFDHSIMKKFHYNKLKLILENTNQIISRTNTIIKNEASVYNAVRWFVEIIYPETRKLNKSRFIKKLANYHPDILVPEIASAIEYKYIKKGMNVGIYIDQLKTDSQGYTGDPDYKFFYAVVVFEDKNELNNAAFERSITEKSFPENWFIIAV